MPPNASKRLQREGRRKLQKHTLEYVPDVELNQTRIGHLERIRRETFLRLRLAGWEGSLEGNGKGGGGGGCLNLWVVCAGFLQNKEKGYGPETGSGGWG